MLPAATIFVIVADAELREPAVILPVTVKLFPIDKLVIVAVVTLNELAVTFPATVRLVRVPTWVTFG